MDIQERVEIAILNKYYGKLLTEKQREILSMYVDNNLSLQEVSDELNISRQAVKDTLDKAVLTLKRTEEMLKFLSRDRKILSLLETNLDKIDESLKNKIISILEDN